MARAAAATGRALPRPVSFTACPSFCADTPPALRAGSSGPVPCWAITAAICQSPEAHPDPQKRWLAAMAAGGFYLLAGLFGGSITALMSALPTAWIQMLAGLALLGTIGGSLFQAVHQASERDAAVLTFLITASGVTLAGIGSAFWGVVLGGVSYGVLSALRRP